MQAMPSMAPVDDVSGSGLMATCAVFAERMKLSGTPDELASMRNIQAALDAYGYRTKLISHDAYISLPGEADVIVDGQSLQSITHSFSISSPIGGLTAKLVYIGDGTAAAFAGRDLRGCIVLVDGIASPAVADQARQAGAAGQLHISPHEHLHEMCISPVWGSPGATNLAMMPATVACTISQKDGAALCERLTKGETLHVTMQAEVDTGWRHTPILVADLDGPDPDGPFVLFTGHHDTWYFGVMDNGSANATMMECARVLATRRDAWRRGFRLCFWSGHSHGRYSGSAWYVDNHWDELDRRCAVHVNVDSTGGIGASVLTESASASELIGLATDVIHAETNETHQSKRLARNSDMSFWGVGIPSMFGSLSHQPPSPAKMRNALGWWWHTPHDLLDKIDEANLVRDTRVFVAALWRLLTDRVLPLDFATHAQALSAELSKIDASLDGAFSLSSLHMATASLEQAATALARSGTDAAQIDWKLMRSARALVPADYTKGDRFTHDPALPQSPWPILDPIRAFAQATGEARHFAIVDATRARNRMQHALREAVAALSLA